MKIIDLAIVIPTLNEENFIGKLLDSIASQSFLPKEIVIVDAYSKDKTISEIKKRKAILPQLEYWRIPRYTVARQRNFGAKKTKSANILFLDADTELRGKNVLKRYWYQISEKNPDIAIATNMSSTKYWKDKMFFKGMDLIFKISKPIWPMGIGMNMYVKRWTFEKIGGFDEKIAVGEDFEIVQRTVKNNGKFSIFSSPKIYASPRRYVKEGRVKFALKTVHSFIGVLRHGYRNNPIEYEFGNFDNDTD